MNYSRNWNGASYMSESSGYGVRRKDVCAVLAIHAL